MNIKSKISKLMSGLLCFSMIFSNVLPAYATDAAITENTLDGEDLSVNERNLEDITVTYKQASSFFVTIPKTIVLDGWKQSTYAVKVSGDIDAEQCVYVAPVDGIADTENIDFYMKDQASENAKDDVVASVTHNKFHWNATEVAAGHKQDDNLVSAPDLTAGAWRGIFQMEIKLETHVTHTHNYVETITKEPTCTEAGEKTYTCTCGESYTEEIPAKGHHFENGECTDCGEKDPNHHKHSYTETITKQPTCTEAGEKTYTCSCGDSYTEEIPAKGHKDTNGDGICDECGVNDPNHKHSYTEKITKEPTCTEKGEKTYTCKCGNSYTEVIPATGHNFVDGTCANCGKTDLYAVAPASAYSNWNYTLDEANNTITLNYYIGSETDVIVYGNYIINGKTYKTQLASNTDDAIYNKPYMFNGYAQSNCRNIKSIKFSSSIDTSNVMNMSWMFADCTSLTSFDVSSIDTSKVTDMSYMFCTCTTLTSLNVSNFDTSKVTDMSGMFSSCSSLTNLNMSGFDTGNVTDMSGMFSGCSSLTNLNMSSFNTSNVTNMSGMFGSCSSLTNLNMSSFDTSNVTNMSGMFDFDENLVSLDVSNFNTSNVTNMAEMFENCKKLQNLDLGNFDTSNVTDMQKMFSDCWALTSLNVSSFDTSNVTNMNSMFALNHLANLDVSNFNTSKVTDMSYMFCTCTTLTSLNVSNFDTSKVTDMQSMFASCYKLTSLDLSNFDTSNVTNMNCMFYLSGALSSLNVSSFDTGNVTNMRDMFGSCKALTNLDLSSFNTSKVLDMNYMFYGCSALKTIYVTRYKWSTSQASISYMFDSCGTSNVTYK